ncbi:MAG: DNA translocase FtsK 4TM domain-containing protein [Deltaproteobacteria bacterium]|nr:DNA translocase FtsK 4TM domain-containing protein [Deltaproteobacteria bacterium]
MTQPMIEPDERRGKRTPVSLRPDAPASESPRRKNRDIPAIVCFALGVLLVLAFLSYTPEDPGANTATGAAPKNLISFVGSYSSDLLLIGFGYGAYLVPFLLFVYAYVFFYGRSARFSWRTLAGYLGLLFVLASMFALLFMPNTSKTFIVERGGIFGYFISDQLDDVIGRIGAAVVLVAAFFVGLVVSVDFSFASAFAAVIGATRQAVSGAREKYSGWSARRAEHRANRAERAIEALEDMAESPMIHAPKAAASIGDDVVIPPIETMDDPQDFPARPVEIADGVSPSRDFPVQRTRIEEPAPRRAPEPGDEDMDPYVDDLDESLDDLSDLWEEPDGVAAPRKSRATVEAGPKIKERADAHRPPEQIEMPVFTGAYQPPPIDLMEHYLGRNIPVDRDGLITQSQILVKKLEDFGVKGRVSDVHPGPIVTMFEFEPSPGIKINKIAALEDDLAMVLRAQSVRIIAPIPGKGAVGIEVPNRRRETIYIRELIESPTFQSHPSPLAVAFGKDITGHPVVEDLSKMPHLLVAGTTGSGKSVFINTIITSILYKSPPEDVKLILIDPKMLELSDYADIPHLLCPVCTQPKKAASILRWAVAEMEHRYQIMSQASVRNIASHNKKIDKLISAGGKRKAGEEPLRKLPYIVVIIDELADLMMVAAKELEESIARLAQMARAAGIHLLLATQRPSVDVVTGVIKANFPARVSFKVSSKVDSRTILDAHGAHVLLGNGDMLYLPPTESQLRRIHGCWIAETEVQAIVKFIKEKNGSARFDPRVTEFSESDAESGGDDFTEAEVDPEYDRALEIVARERKASVSYIQRRLKIGYNRAARIMEMMEREGVVAPSDGTSRPRDVLIPPPRGERDDF